jgi:aspartate/methionine/tyrosine aminotransferase
MVNPQAEELNEKIGSNNPTVYDLLSEKGREIFFPAKGILAQAGQAKGKDINATIGMALEDDGTPMRLKCIEKQIDVGPKDAFPYAPSFGKPQLRETWKDIIIKKNPSLEGKGISLPVVTNGLTHGLSMCGYLFVNSGDKIISPDLFWGNYKLVFIRGYGAEIDAFPLFRERGFNIDGLKEKLMTEGDKKIVVLNFPNNPTGYTPTEEEQKGIVAVIKEAAESGKKVLVLVDDAYFGLVYQEGVARESIFPFLADLHENVLAVKLDGATKEDYVWGFRIGFITYGTKGADDALYSALESKTAGAIRGSISNDSHLSQSLLLKAYNDSDYQKEKQEKYNLLKKRADTVSQILEEHPEYADCFTPLPFNSGYFMCVRLKEKDAEETRQRLLSEYSTGLIALGKDKVRVAFSSVPTEQLPKLFENLYRACE